MIRTAMGDSQRQEKKPLDEDPATEFSELFKSPAYTVRRQPRQLLPATRERSSIRSLISFMKSVVGKDLTKVTMPVHFNEPVSFLQRLTEDLEYADILNRACYCKNSLVRIAHVAAFACSTYSTVLNRSVIEDTSAKTTFWKPFNPLLGETFEYINHDVGYALLVEQVSHHPPISALHAESEHWIFWQEYRLETKFRGQFFKVIPTGMVHVKFKGSGHHFSWKKPITTIHNILLGSLYVDQEGDCLVTNYNTRETCVMHFKPERKVQENFKKLSGEVRDAEGHVRYLVDGAWDRGLECYSTEGGLNGEPTDLWTANKKPEESPKMYAFTRYTMQLNDPGYETRCPTDCRKRTDISLLDSGKIDASAIEKRHLEEKQRLHRKERELTGEAWTPRWFVPREEPDTGTFCYVYKGGYWRARLQGQFPDGSPDIY